HGAFALGLLALCGGILGLKAGLWALVLLSSVCTIGVMTLWFWENRGWLEVIQRGEHGVMVPVSPVLPVKEGVSSNGTANI
ncbi:MAG: hypothetical protein ACRERD_32470, partial [Candidatus Binatia bacterium]